MPAKKILLSTKEQLTIRGALITEFHILQEQLKTAPKVEQVTISEKMAELKSLVDYLTIN